MIYRNAGSVHDSPPAPLRAGTPVPIPLRYDFLAGVCLTISCRRCGRGGDRRANLAGRINFKATLVNCKVRWPCTCLPANHFPARTSSTHDDAVEASWRQGETYMRPSIKRTLTGFLMVGALAFTAVRADAFGGFLH